GDPGLPYLRAWLAASQGDADGALALLRSLDEAGWSNGMDPADFPALADRPELKALAARFAARVPATPHAPLAATLAEPGLVAEGIAADPRDGALYVGSMRLRKIVRVDPGGAVRDLVPPGAGLDQVLGIKVDAARGLLWAASFARADAAAGTPARTRLLAFDLATGAPRRSAGLDGPGHMLNDLAVGEDGTVYATDSEGGEVWRLDPGAAALVAAGGGRRWVYANGIAIADGRLLVADATGLWDLPRDGGAPRRLRGPGRFPLTGIDGLSAAGRTLVAVQNGAGTPRIIRLELEPGAAGVRTAEVLETANPGWRVPTTGALVPGAFVYIGNSHVDGWKDGKLAPAGMEPTRIYRLPL
ncbi:SMP-30/gluconolactonase/LRE family protein, partial [Anaeromyxobacter sp. PSR-1]|uniref:SMP-30/gluconolactonase/LRE family protein n=1 Tax=Anaeromyxobacter sp. PSR-1 TaxID=1300915 RepID=UPI0007518CF5